MTMDQLILKLIEQTPSTAAVIVVVVIFTKFTSKRDAVWQKLHTEAIAEHLDARKASKDALDRNTEAMIKNIEASTKLSDRIMRIESVCPITRGDLANMASMRHQSGQ